MYGEADEWMARKMDGTTDGGWIMGGEWIGTTVDGQSNADVLASMATPSGTVLFMMKTPAVLDGQVPPHTSISPCHTPDNHWCYHVSELV